MPSAHHSQPPFVEHCLELLATLGPVRAKRMFGGWGLYADDLFVALIADERLYLKTDEAGSARMRAEGCEPFTYVSSKGTMVMNGYWSAPVDAMDSPALMQPWARAALQAALAAKAAKPAKPASPKKTAARPSAPTQARAAPPKRARPR